jgi:hypothetical protein
MLKKSILWSLGIIGTLVFTFLFYLIFVVKISFVNTDKDKSIKVTGIIESLYLGGINDVVFTLENNANLYYINRGTENGIDLERFQKDLVGKEVSLWHAKSRASNGGHMMQLKHKDSIYYSEWEIPLESKN